MFISTISQTMDIARHKFTRSEQLMLIDIFNGTLLTPLILGQHLLAQVEDSFALYPGMYEEKWKVDCKEMEKKIRTLSNFEAALVELWAVGYWSLMPGFDDGTLLENYIQGKFNLESRLREEIKKLQSVSDRLEKTKSAFKSATVAEARKTLDETIIILHNLL